MLKFNIAVVYYKSPNAIKPLSIVVYASKTLLSNFGSSYNFINCCTNPTASLG